MTAITTHKFDATEPHEMHEELFNALARSHPLVHACMAVARRDKLSETDYLAMLAYHALDALQKTQHSYMAELSLNPRPIVAEKAS